MGKNVVSIVKAPEKPSQKEIDASVREAIELAGGLTDIISRGDTVLISPNLVIPQPPETGATTDPRICQSIANMVKEIGCWLITNALIIGAYERRSKCQTSLFTSD